jgi:hypothetical protein
MSPYVKHRHINVMMLGTVTFAPADPELNPDDRG